MKRSEFIYVYERKLKYLNKWLESKKENKEFKIEECKKKKYSINEEMGKNKIESLIKEVKECISILNQDYYKKSKWQTLIEILFPN